MFQKKVLIIHYEYSVINKLYQLLKLLNIPEHAIAYRDTFAGAIKVLNNNEKSISLIFLPTEAVSYYRGRNEMSEVEELISLKVRTCIQIDKSILDEIPVPTRFNSNVLNPRILEVSEYTRTRRWELEGQIKKTLQGEKNE